MATVPSEIELIPLAADVPAAVRLARLGIVAAYTRSGPAVDAEPRIAWVTERIHSGEMTEGRVCRLGGRSVGIAFWETGHPRGITLQVLYLEPTVARRSRYEAVLSALTSGVAPLVFTPGGLVGLSDGEESAMMRALGYERFSRSEMRWPPSLVPPPLRASDGIAIRPVLAADEPTVATLHLAAFGGTFDQYMYLSDLDPVVDAGRAVREMMTGRYGEFLGWASTIAESGGRPVGASLVIRAMFGPLLISVMVDRASQGQGIGRTMVLANLHALRARGETFAALNVTEGNTRAVQLYEHLGFVRSLGPEHSWYSRTAVPVAPGEILRDPPSSPSPGTTGSGANRTPRT
jgi:ribosomal protein S18 acetylase RimI-like enzyme